MAKAQSTAKKVEKADEAQVTNSEPAKRQVLVQNDSPVHTDRETAVPTNTDGQTDEVVKSMPGSEYPSPNPPVAPDSEEADPNPVPDPIEVKPSDNPSPGRNAVPVSADNPTVHLVDRDADGNPINVKQEDLVPGTNVPQPAAPKSGSLTR